MSDTDPESGGGMTGTTDGPAAGASAAHAQTPLEDVMVAMDVVDTVRHRQILIDRELDADARRHRLRERLREIYGAQGIEVTDQALDAGIAALEQERFRYEPSGTGFARWLARLYVTRERWGRRARIFGIFGAIAIAIWLFDSYLPNRRLQSELPAEIDTVYDALVAAASSDDAVAAARALNAEALAAIDDGDYDDAEDAKERLENLLSRVRSTYDVRIVVGPDDFSGVWRIPDVNESARNYYLIVEAVGPTGNIVSVPIFNEETGTESTVNRWGVRVSEQTFESVAADRRDDGIVQNNIVGAKRTGELLPDYDIATLGGYITSW